MKWLQTFMFVVFAVSLAMAKPNFERHDAQAAGLTVLTPDDPQFSVELMEIRLNPKSNMPGFELLEPYSMIIVNTTNQPIMMISIRWEDKTGRFRANYTLWTRPHIYDGSFMPGEALLIVPGIPLTGRVGPGFVQLTGKVPHLFSAGDDLTGIVDGVLFQDGKLIGKDKSGHRVGLKAERQALEDTEQDLKKLVDAGQDTAPYLQSLKLQMPPVSTGIEGRPSDTAYRYAMMRMQIGAVLRNIGSDPRSLHRLAKGILDRMKVVQ
ncbi:MAG: hypothetical protein LAP40_20100 [Acidobacteriia bacterium]|nr:hypothetical protein [Terriglobia bacterium]